MNLFLCIFSRAAEKDKPKDVVRLLREASGLLHTLRRVVADTGSAVLILR